MGGRRCLARWTLVAGLACLAAFVLMRTLAIPDDGPLHDWFGLLQRAVVLLGLFPIRVALSLRMLRVADRASHAPASASA